MENNLKKVKVTIFGKSYLLSTDESEETISRLAQILDSKMKEIASKSPIKDGYSLAILSALQIIKELEKSKKELNALQAQAATLDSLLNDQVS